MKNYFKPEVFEFVENKTIYDFVGIKVFKKYLPFTGDIARKWANKKQINLDRTTRNEELYRYELETRKNEMRHLFALIAFVLLIFIIDKKLNVFDVIFLTTLNLVLNIYPIMLQRYNRIRIIKVLLRNGLPSPYK
ncbi:MAG: hypothetical protein KDC49_13685 [Saprospiraceae bacterium]|nr:hypothetical protein [Saprospiraceae bacterium]